MLDVDDGTLSVCVIYRLPLLSNFGQKDTIASSSNPGRNSAMSSTGR